MNHRPVNLVVSSKNLNGNAVGIPPPNLPDYIGVQLMCVSTLLRAVLHIVFASTHKQMFRIYAVANVAFVAYVKSVGYRAVMNFPRDAVGLTVGSFRILQRAVSGDSDCPDPKPASLGFLDLAPKLFFQRECLAEAETFTPAVFKVRTRRKDLERGSALQASFGDLFDHAGRVFAGSRAIQRSTLQSGRRYAEIFRTVLTGSGNSCYVSISHAAYVSIVRGLVRLAPAFNVPVRAI
jgi:hypothetical protein